MFEDKTLKCKECGADFIFTAGEQEFYAEKGFQNATECDASHSMEEIREFCFKEFAAVCLF